MFLDDRHYCINFETSFSKIQSQTEEIHDPNIHKTDCCGPQQRLNEFS